MLTCMYRAKPKGKNYLKIDLSVREPVGTSFIEEVDVFNQEAEERDNNLKGKKGTQDYITAITDQKLRKETCNQMESI